VQQCKTVDKIVYCFLFHLVQQCKTVDKIVYCFFCSSIDIPCETMKGVTMTRPILLGVRLSKEENQALLLWARSEGLDRSVLLRRVFRLALRNAPHTMFPPKIAQALHLSDTSDPAPATA
jgi:hypothetical protein